jgi:hypothetical protein
MLTSTHQPAAALARERLLVDPAMRRNTSTPEIPPITVTFPVTVLNDEQKRHLMQIARTFRDYYLAHITYDSDLAVAYLNPVNEWDDPLEIQMDANGDISVISCGDVSFRPAVRRILLLSLLLLILAITLIVCLV